MRTMLLTAASAFLLPIVASAGPINSDYLVRYEGTVSDLDPAQGPDVDSINGYEVGDFVSGWLLVDLRESTPDLAPEAGIGQYGYGFSNSPPGRSAFVRATSPERAHTSDRVQIADEEETVDWLDVLDYESGTRTLSDGRKQSAADATYLSAGVRLGESVDFLQGDGIVQDFGLTTELAGSVSSTGQIYYERAFLDDALSRVGGTIHLALSKLSYRPGKCTF